MYDFEQMKDKLFEHVETKANKEIQTPEHTSKQMNKQNVITYAS